MLTPFDPIRQIERLFAESVPTDEPRLLPMDAVRHADHVELTFDLPGFRPEDIDVSYDRHLLTVSAERTLPELPEDSKQLVRERSHRRVVRQITLSDVLDPTNITAAYTDGVLKLTVPVQPAAQPQKIQVTTAPAPIETTEVPVETSEV